MNPSRKRITRRRFLGSSAAALSAPALLSSVNGKTVSANERITLGVVGCGGRGFQLLNDIMAQKDAQIVAVCDVDAHHHRDLPWGVGPALGRLPAQKKVEKHYGSQVTATDDFREICARKDIDAVVVATPDHWHALCTLEALKNGKDVYCEKPVTHTFHEGQMVYREVAKRKAVFQTGSQQRSEVEFHRAVELVRNGHLGAIRQIEVGLPTGYEKPMGDATVADPPKQLNYDLWCGPSPVLPYMRARHHRWWRGHRAYGGGVLMDWIGHHNDIAHWAMNRDASGPTKVEAVGWTFPNTDVYDSPQQYEIRCEYANGTTTTIANRFPVGTKFIGEDGWLFVTRRNLQTSKREWKNRNFDTGSFTISTPSSHMRNFLNCVKSRKQCIAPAETAHRSITPGHLGYVSNALGAPLQWDSKTETILDNEKANELLHKNDYREPWSA